MNIQSITPNGSTAIRKSLTNQVGLQPNLVRELFSTQQQLHKLQSYQNGSLTNKRNLSIKESIYSSSIQMETVSSNGTLLSSSSYFDEERDQMDSEMEYSSHEDLTPESEESYQNILRSQENGQGILNQDAKLVVNHHSLNEQTDQNDNLFPNLTFSAKPLDSQIRFDQQTRIFVLAEKSSATNKLSVNNCQEESFQQNQLVNGLKFINSITHRIDQQCIEINMENLYLQQNSQEQLLQKLNQLEEEYTPLQQLIKQISETTNNNEEYSESIQQEGNHPDLLAHQENRSRISEEKYNKITSQIDPSSLLVYVKHSVNYQRGIMQSTVAGYTPALYELLMNSSYEFKQFIQTRGFVDPTSWKMATSDNDIIGQSQFLSSPQNIQEETNLNFQDVEIMSFDNQRFPASHNITVHNLVEDYDKEHNLQLKFSDVLIVHSFTLKYPDQLVVYNLKKTEKKDSSSTKNSEILRKSISKYKQTSDSSSNELLDKYYGDQLENLIKKGSKWYKRCGYIDIPKKKTRKINQ